MGATEDCYDWRNMQVPKTQIVNFLWFVVNNIGQEKLECVGEIEILWFP